MYYIYCVLFMSNKHLSRLVMMAQNILHCMKICAISVTVISCDRDDYV